MLNVTFSASLEDLNMNNCISVMRHWSSRKLHWSSFIFNVWLLFVTKYFTKQWASLHSAAAVVWGSPWKPSTSRHEALCKDWPVRLYRCVCGQPWKTWQCFKWTRDGNSTVLRLSIVKIGLNIDKSFFPWTGCADECDDGTFSVGGQMPIQVYGRESVWWTF